MLENTKVSPANEYQDHHFIPAFYTKGWIGDDNKLAHLEKIKIPNGYKPVIKRVYPGGTGFETHAYSMKFAPEEESQSFESGFLKLLDTQASNVLNDLRSGIIPSSEKHRKIWADFLISLLLRTPEDFRLAIKHLEGEFQNNNHTPYEPIYRNVRSSNDPETFAEYMSLLSAQTVEWSAFEIVARVISSNHLNLRISKMRWFVLNLSDHPVNFMASDKPLIMSPLKLADAFILLPISPNQVFFAVYDLKAEGLARSWPKKKLVEFNNKYVVGQANKYIYAESEYELRDVYKSMGKLSSSSMIERLIARSWGRIE